MEMSYRTFSAIINVKSNI